MTRAHLLLTSALVLAASPGRAQALPPPNALPTGMRVIAGAAVSSTHGNTLQVTQSSNRAALDWSSFNIGSNATVRFHDPSAQAMTLNRVSGPDASVIAGRLSSNGQMVLINQSGVVFMPGAVVDAQSIVVSAAGITEAGMRSGVATGRFVLDQPARAGAVVQNNGRISVRRAGLAALVAPSVANHGSINAPFGSVSLLGVSSHVVDLYGDGLLSIDVSRQTITDGGGGAALVTNDGVITARGGQVTLSTAAVDGLVSNLVEAGGSIAADSAGRHGGRVVIDAEGGTATVTGSISARGLGAANSVGGEIAIEAGQLVTLAAGARVDASGRGGGGVVAIGTTLARARGGVGVVAPAAATVDIAPGASVLADAMSAGQGGQITVLSTASTAMAGSLSVRGGAVLGDGGTVEVSGFGALALSGGVDVDAVRGRAGTLVLDPTNIVIGAGSDTIDPGGTVSQAGNITISPATLQGFNGNIDLIASSDITIGQSFTLTLGHDLTLQAGGGIFVNQAFSNTAGSITMTAVSGITVSAGASIAASGALSLTTSGSGAAITAAAGLSGGTALNLTASGALTQQAGAPFRATGAGGFIALSAGGLITLNDLIASPVSVNLAQGSGVVQSGGSITTPSLFSSGSFSGPVVLNRAGNSADTVGSFNVTGGRGTGFSLIDTAPTVTINSPITVTNGPITVTVPAGSLAVDAALSTVGTGVISLSANTDITVSASVTAADALALTAAEGLADGAVLLNADGSLTSTNNAIALSAGSSIELAGNVTATSAIGSLNVEHGGTFSLPGGVVQTGGSITTTSLFSASGIGGSVSLTQPGNSIDSIGVLAVTGSFSLTDVASSATVDNPITAGGNVSIVENAGSLVVSQQVQSGVGQTISLTAPQIAFGGAGFLLAPGGTVELAPQSAAVTLGVSNGFSFVQADLVHISANLLRIGKTAGGGQATSITVAGTFDVLDAEAANTLELDAGSGGIAIDAGPLVATTLLLGTPGLVSQAADAAIQGQTLAGVSTLGTVELAGTLNTTGTLGPIAASAGGEINFATENPLSLVGTISSPGGLTLNAGGTISLAGSLNVGTLSLTTQPSEGGSDVIWTTPFSATAIEGSVAGTVSLIDSNPATTTLGPLSGQTSVSVTSTAGGLSTAGTVSATGVTLAANGALNIGSTINANLFNLSAASISEDTTLGHLDGHPLNGGPFVGVLTSTGGVTAAATLLGSNALTRIQGFVAGGTLALADTRSLAIAAGVGASSAFFHVGNGGSIEVDVPLAIPSSGTLGLRADTLVLNGAAGSDVISNATGTIDLIAVAPDSTIPVQLGGAAAPSGTLTIGSTLLGALLSTTLEVGGIGGVPSASSIAIQSTSLASGRTLLVDTDVSGGVTQTGGLTVGTLGGIVGSGGVVLLDTLNAIGAIGTLTVLGGATLVDAAPSLTIVGAFSAADAGTLAIAVDRLSFAGGTLAAGTVAIGPRTAGHTLGIADPGAAFDIELGDLSRIAAGRLIAGNSFIAGTSVALGIGIAGSASFAHTLELDAGASGVSQTAGILSAPQLQGSSGGVFDVNQTLGNSIGVLGNVTAASSISIDDSGAPVVSVAGGVAADNGTLHLRAASVAIGASSSLSATGGSVLLQANALSGTVVDTTGTVAITPFSGGTLDVGTAVSLAGVTASVIQLGSLDGSTAAIVFSGPVSSGLASLQVFASGTITEDATGVLSAPTLSGTAAALLLPNANAVGTVAGFAVTTGNFSLTNGGLAIDGAVAAGNAAAPQTITVDAPSITLGAGAGFSTALASSSGELVLRTDALSGQLVAAVPGGTVLLERRTAGPQSFAQTGSITAGTLQIGGDDLSSTSLTLGTLGSIDVTALRLVTSGAVTQGGSIVEPSATLTGQAGSVLLTAPGNMLAALGGFNITTPGGDFTLADAIPLAIAGNVAIGTGTLSLTDLAVVATTGLSLDAAIDVQAATLVLALPNGGGVSQDPTGTLQIGTLSGAVLGNVVLPGTDNAVAAIGTLSVGGQLSLVDASLTEDAGGILNAGTLTGTFGGDVHLDGTANVVGELGAITAGGTLTLTAADPTLAGVVQAGEISLAVDGINYLGGELQATGVFAGRVRALLAASGTVEIGPRTSAVLNLGTAAVSAPFVSAGVLASVNAGTLILGRSLDGPTATGIAVNASVAVSSAQPPGNQAAVVDLETVGAGPVFETNGASFGVPGTLTGNTGAVSLLSPGNLVPVLGPYSTSATGFALADNGPLAIAGDVAASGITLVVAGSLALAAGSLLAPGGTVDLTAAGASETGGIIVAATLDSTGTPSGDFVLTGANQVGTLGSWNASGSLTLVDDSSANGPAALTVAGPVDVTALALQAKSIALAGNVTSAGSVSLATTAGGVTQSAGTLSAAILSSTGVAGDVVLGAAGNAVSALGPFNAAGHGFTLTDASPLDVTGALAADRVLLTDPASISVNAAITAPLITVRGGALAIGAGGLLLAAGGTVDLVASSATETAGGVIQAATLLSGGTPGGAFVLGDANSIDTLGNFQMAAGGTLLLADTTGLALAGVISAAAADLSTTAGGVTEISGSLVTALLSSSFGIAGGATLDSAGNAVAALGSITLTSGDLEFAQAGSLGITGTVSAADIALRIGGGLLIGNPGTLQASGTVDLTAAGAAEAASGVIAAATLDSTEGASGQFALFGANRVATLGMFANGAGALALTDTQALTVAGPVDVGYLALSAPSVALSGTVTTGVLQVATTAGDLTQTGSSVLTAGLLSAPQGIAGAVSLGSANRIAALGDFTAKGQMSLVDTVDLDITGAVAARTGLSLTLAGVNLSEGVGGSVATPLLTGTAGSLTLTQTANGIDALAFATSGTLALVDARNLTIDALSGNGAAIGVSGSLTLAGNVSEAGTGLALGVTGAVLQTAGTVSAPMLLGTAASISLGNDNAISVLGGIAAPDGLILVNATALAIEGTVQAGSIELDIHDGGLTENAGGALVAGLLTSRTGIFGDAVLTGANAVAAIGPLFDSGRFAFADTRALTVGGLVAQTLDLSTSAGGISQTGPIQASLLTSSFGIAGGAQFSDPGNQIATLGAMGVTGGDLAVVTAQSLTVSGPVGAPDIALTVAGTIAQVGDIVTPGTFATNSGGQYRRSGGVLAVGTLSGSAGSVANFGTDAAVLRLGAFTVHDNGDGAAFVSAANFSTLSIADGTAMTLAGPVLSDYVAITATGTLIWSGDLTTFGQARLDQELPVPSLPGSFLQVVAGAGGTAQIQQIGLVHVAGQDGIATLRLQLPSTGGSIVFSDLQAPQADLLLFIGAGHATGSIDVGDLLVSGKLGSATLTGTVRGLFGAAAAREANLTPQLNASYRLNSCPIQSVNCILLPIETVPQQNPLHDLAIGQARDELDDTDILLPNVAEQDY